MKTVTPEDAEALLVVCEESLIDSVSRTEEVFVPFAEKQWPEEWPKALKVLKEWHAEHRPHRAWEDGYDTMDAAQEFIESQTHFDVGSEPTQWDVLAALFNFNEWVNDGFWAMYDYMIRGIDNEETTL